MGGLVSAGFGLVGAGIESNATTNAANIQAAAANNATAVQQQEFNTQQANEAPWLAAGQASLSQLQSMATNPTQFSFSAQDFANNQDPAYQFDLQQGQQAIQRSAAAQGTLMSGGTLKDLTNYSQGQASNEYSNSYSRAYQNFTNSQNTQFSRLSTLAGIGQTATAGVNAAGQNYANNVSNIGMSLGNAQAAGQIAQGNIWGNTISGIGNGLGKYLGQPAPGGGGGSSLQQQSYGGSGTLSSLSSTPNSLAYSEMG